MMINKEILDDYWNKINKVTYVLYDVSVYNIQQFRTLLKMRNENPKLYWQMIDAWYNRIQKGEVVSNNTKLI